MSLLLADVEGSTRLWETQPDEMTAAIARLDATLTDLVVAFARASDAVACALALQRAPLAPIRLRIGVNTGEIQLRDEGNYVGPTINRTARLRDLGHGGQTLLSGATESMVLDHLPDDAWLSDHGAHPLRDLPRPERVVQLCHPDIRNEFPALRTTEPENAQRLPAQLTKFIGRERQISEVRELLAANRLVTLTGAGGSGKTRLAIQSRAIIPTTSDTSTWRRSPTWIWCLSRCRAPSGSPISPAVRRWTASSATSGISGCFSCSTTASTFWMHAEVVGDHFIARMCRYWGRGVASFQRGDVTEAFSVLRGLLAEAEAAKDVFHGLLARVALAHGMLTLGHFTDAMCATRWPLPVGSRPFTSSRTRSRSSRSWVVRQGLVVRRRAWPARPCHSRRRSRMRNAATESARGRRPDGHR